MAETVEARFTFVSTLAGVAYAAEGEGGNGAVYEGVVDGGAAGADLAQAAVGFGGVAEGVEAEGGGVDFVGDADGLVEVVDREDGH